jgi:rhamnulokinase
LSNNFNATNVRSIAIDLGAGSGRLIAGEIAMGKWKLTEMSRFVTPIVEDARSGYMCWEIDSIVLQIENAIEKCAALGNIDSLGVDSWGVDYVLLDKDLRRIGQTVCYRDKRTAGIMERVHSRISREDIYRRTGIQFQPFNTIYQLAAAVEQEPEWMRAAQHLLMIPDYLHFALSSVLSNEYTNATTTQLLGVNGEWDAALLHAVGLKRNLMQPPVNAATILGQTKVGNAWVKVIAPATHDTASAVAGTPLESTDEAFISSGTWSLMGIESMVPITTEDALRMNFTNEGGIERRFRVLKNIMGMWPIQRLCEEHHVTDVAALVDQAAIETAWRSIVNPDDALFMNPPSMTEAIRDYCRQTQQPAPKTIAQLARCIYDSLALSYKFVMEQLEQLRGRKITKIRIVGGGCKNRLLNQLCADACQLAVIAGPVEASALGNLSAQMIALGVIENLDAARALIGNSFESQEFLPKANVPVSVENNFKTFLKNKYRETVSCA